MKWRWVLLGILLLALCILLPLALMATAVYADRVTTDQKMVVAMCYMLATGQGDILEAVGESAMFYHLDVVRWMRQVYAEAGFANVENGPCHGPAQINEDYWGRFDDPIENIYRGAEIMRIYLNRYEAYPEALVAYCYGPLRVDDLKAKHGSEWAEYLPHSVSAYVEKVMGRR